MMSKVLFWGSGVFGVLVLAVYLAGALAQPPAQATAARVPPPPTLIVAASTLYDAFRANAIAAEAKYKGEYLKVHGEVDRVGRTNAGTPYVTFKRAGAFTVQALFDAVDSTAALAELKPGKYAFVVCRYNNVQSNVVLHRCRMSTGRDEGERR